MSGQPYSEVMNSAGEKAYRWHTFERFSFKDGVRFAWVRWERVGLLGERRWIDVSEAAECPWPSNW